MAIPTFDKFKSVTAEGKVADYDEIADIPIIRKDLSTGGNSTGYYLHIGATSTNFTNGAIYFYSESKNKYYIIDGGAENQVEYASVQALEDGRYNIKGYVKSQNDDAVLINTKKYVSITTLEGVTITGNESSAVYLRLEASTSKATLYGKEVWLYGDVYVNSTPLSDLFVPIHSTENILIGSTENVYISASEGNEEIYINLQKSNKDIAIAGDTIHLSGEVYINGTLLSELIGSGSSDGDYVAKQDLEEGRINLSNYFKEFDSCRDDNYTVAYSPSFGITWNNTFEITTANDHYTGKYYGNAPIVAGKNVTFDVDEENHVVKINSNVSKINVVTLLASGWQGEGVGCRQSVAVTGLTDTNHCRITPSSSPISNIKAYTEAGIYATSYSVAQGMIWFECETKPYTDIAVYVEIFEGDFV